jgi:hypothetical protein
MDIAIVHGQINIAVVVPTIVAVISVVAQKKCWLIEF